MGGGIPAGLSTAGQRPDPWRLRREWASEWSGSGRGGHPTAIHRQKCHHRPECGRGRSGSLVLGLAARESRGGRRYRCSHGWALVPAREAGVEVLGETTGQAEAVRASRQSERRSWAIVWRASLELLPRPCASADARGSRRVVFAFGPVGAPGIVPFLMDMRPTRGRTPEALLGTESIQMIAGEFPGHLKLPGQELKARHWHSRRGFRGDRGADLGPARGA